jgi:exopolysaccharide biosynthesis polyprenyl glycosylphosphotransferase
MTKRHLMALRLLLILGDGVAAVLVFLFVSYVRFVEGDPLATWSVGIDIRLAAIAFALTWVAVLWLLGLYRLRVRWSLVTEARDIIRATVLLVMLTLSTLFVFHQDDVSRLFLGILFVTQPAVAVAGRALLRVWFDTLRRQGRNTSFMLVVGTGTLAQQFADRVEARAGLGIRIIGHLAPPGDAADPADVSRPILGTIDDIGGIFRTRIVDEVAVCLSAESAEYTEPIIALAADEGKTVRIPRAPDEELMSIALQEEFEGFLVRSVVHDGQREVELIVKRVLDVIGAAAALVILSPLLIVTALVIRVRDGAPVLFRQTRVGRHGRTFTIYKFRTMVPDADERYDVVTAEAKPVVYRRRGDPRVTRTGRFLRRSSIDELPQLFNVLRGDMSLVGPRPPLPREVKGYDIWHRRRLSMRPGMTGLWQIQARLDHHFDEVAELDLKYIDEWSLWKDLGILLRTVPAVLLARGR